MKAKLRMVFVGRNRHPIYPTTLVAVVIAAGSLPVFSQWINWGGDYVHGPQDFSGSYSSQDNLDLDNDGLLDDSRFGFAFQSSSPTPLNPSTGYSGISGTFYGGFAVNTLDNPSAAGDQLQPGSHGVKPDGPDYMEMHTQHSGNHHHTFSFFAYWDKQDFLGVTPSQTIGLDPSANFSLTIRNASNVQDDIHLHFLLRQGNQLYASQAFFGGTGTSVLETGYQGAVPDGGTVNFNPLALGLGWKPYNPDGLDLQWTHGLWETPTFDNITGAGFYFDTLNFTQNNSQLAIDGFSFTSVPEPSAVAFVLGTLGVMLLRHRRSFSGARGGGRGFFRLGAVPGHWSGKTAAGTGWSVCAVPG